MEQNVLVTGGAGVIGSELVDRLLRDNKVLVVDNLSSGKVENIKPFMKNKNFTFIETDVQSSEKLAKLMEGIDKVFHLAANPDIRFEEQGATDKDLKQNTIGTYNVLEAMRLNDVKKIIFSSSSAVYGEAKVLPTPETYGPLIPISLYGASKIACEGMISAFCELYGMQSWIYRFANIIGDKVRKIGINVIPVFIKLLRKTPKKLGTDVLLGDGKQKKSYLTIEDCIEGMLYLTEHATEKVNLYNLGAGDWITVEEILRLVIERMGLKNIELEFPGGDRGWPGDVPKTYLDVAKANKAGWKAKFNSREAVVKSIDALLAANDW